MFRNAWFLGAPQAAAENQGLSASREWDTRATGETAVSPRSWTCLACGEPLRPTPYPSGRGFKAVCMGTDSNPHRFQMYVSKLRRQDVLLLLCAEFHTKC